MFLSFYIWFMRYIYIYISGRWTWFFWIFFCNYKKQFFFFPSLEQARHPNDQWEYIEYMMLSTHGGFLYNSIPSYSIFFTHLRRSFLFFLKSTRGCPIWMYDSLMGSLIAPHSCAQMSTPEEVWVNYTGKHIPLVFPILYNGR